jgi:ssDNA-binding Zn-finger/Zn-ribbon topoisomerase 1
VTKCNRCGSKLVKKINGKTKREFMGCSAWPKCSGPVYIPYEYPISDPDAEFEKAGREFDEWYRRMKVWGLL